MLEMMVGKRGFEPPTPVSRKVTTPNGYGRQGDPIFRIDFPNVYISIDQRKLVMALLAEETV